MSSARLVASVAGRFFGGAVSEAGGSATAPAESPGREIPDPIRVVLSQLLFTLKGEERDECNALVVERMHLNETCRAFIERLAAQAREKLIQEHETLKAECVAQQQRIEAFNTNICELEQDFHRKNAITVNAQVRVTDAEQARKNLSRFAPASEKTKADEAIETARHNLEVASGAEASIREEINRLTFVDLPRLKEKFRQLSAEELRLHALVTGQGYTDEELGIVVPGRI